MLGPSRDFLLRAEVPGREAAAGVVDEVVGQGAAGAKGLEHPQGRAPAEGRGEHAHLAVALGAGQQFKRPKIPGFDE